jgi:hypothetical protein
MLASGGLSGGLSSSIAGGNFFDGVRQGLITSGLNHLAHMAVEGDDDGDPKPKPKPKKAPSLKETNKFYGRPNGKRSDIYQVQGSSVDLNFVDTTGWVVGNTYPVQALFSSDNGTVFGKLNVTYKGSNQVQIQNDYYDFNMEFSNPLQVSEFFSVRNFLTAVGDIYAGYGVPFTFTFQGLTTITPRVYNFERGPKY